MSALQTTEPKAIPNNLFTDDPRQHAIYQLRNHPVLAYPYPHAFIRDIFPEDYYRDLIAHLPDDSAYTP